MVRVEGWEGIDGSQYVLRGGRLVLATDDELARTVHNAMLLSQGAERAIEMHEEEVLAQTSEPSAR